MVYTDGAYLQASGAGGWAAVIRMVVDAVAGDPITLGGGEARTTSNRMEMTAVIEALKAVPDGAVEINSDSQYVIKGITEWVGPWKSRGWKNAAGRRVRNRDLWKSMDALAAGREITWRWVKGHAGDRANEEVDRLAFAQACAVGGAVRIAAAMKRPAEAAGGH